MQLSTVPLTLLTPSPIWLASLVADVKSPLSVVKIGLDALAETIYFTSSLSSLTLNGDTVPNCANGQRRSR